MNATTTDTSAHYNRAGSSSVPAVCGRMAGKWVDGAWTGGIGNHITSITCVACRATADFRADMAAFVADADRDDMPIGGRINAWADYPHLVIGTDGDASDAETA